MTTWNYEAAQHLRAARLALLGDGLPSSERDRRLAAFNDLVRLCQRHGLMAAEQTSPPPRLRRVA